MTLVGGDMTQFYLMMKGTINDLLTKLDHFVPQKSTGNPIPPKVPDAPKREIKMTKERLKGK